MKIVIKSSRKYITLDVSPNDKIENIKLKIGNKTDINFIYQQQHLENDHTLKDYNINDGSIIDSEPNILVGAECAKNPSNVIGLLKNDVSNSTIKPLLSGKLTKKYIRNTNATGVYEQEAGDCYAYAATSAYLNTILRIPGSRDPPSFTECFNIAKYNGGNGGNPAESIRRLENHFHYGILCDTTDSISIRDAIVISVIVSFWTSEEGWISVSNGQLLRKANGKQIKTGHASLVEGYDFEKDCIICKNSWGDKTAKPRFDFRRRAAHDCIFTRVYYTDESVAEFVSKMFVPNIEKFEGTLNNCKIKCAWMDKTTALYSSDYICEYHPEHQGPLKYLGYDVNQWIIINRPITILAIALPLALTVTATAIAPWSLPFTVGALFLMAKPKKKKNE